MAVKTLPELKVSDLIEYKSSFVDTWDGLDKAAKAFKKQLIEEALEAERTERTGPAWTSHTVSSSPR